ncbi:hypothetical protein NHF46_12750 [Arthrobacter alpinus]|nr:hypothetical protein [Arthrobacter alpinus]
MGDNKGMNTMITLVAAAQQASPVTAFLLPIFGALGVIVGAFITLMGQAAGRRVERRNEIEKLAADMAGSSYLMQASLSGIIAFSALDPIYKTQVAGDKHADALNVELDRTYSLGNQLSIRAPRELRDASICLVNACVKANGYLHLIHGTGRVEQFKFADAFLENIDRNREFMIEHARAIHPKPVLDRIRDAWSFFGRSSVD